MRLKAIVFDFDGVIANTEPLHFRAFKDVLADNGVALSEADYYARYLGFDDVGVFRTLEKDRSLRWSENQVASMVAEKAVRLEAFERNGSVLFPGAADAIRRAAAEVPIAVASGALRDEIVRVLDRTGLSSSFRAIVAAGETPAGKPSPDPYLRALELLRSATGQRFDAAQCFAIEDSRWGLEAAIAAGLRTVAVTSSYPASALPRADVVLDGLADLDLSALSALVAE